MRRSLWKTTCPSSAWSLPPRMFRSVLLPVPFLAIRPTFCPSPMLKQRSRKSVLSPTLRVRFCTCKYETTSFIYDLAYKSTKKGRINKDFSLFTFHFSLFCRTFALVIPKISTACIFFSAVHYFPLHIIYYYY